MVKYGEVMKATLPHRQRNNLIQSGVILAIIVHNHKR